MWKPIGKYALGYLALALLLLASGCKTQRVITEGPDKLKERKTDYLLKRLNTHRLEATWLAAKARVVYRSPEETRRFTSYIRVCRDSVIWMNFKKSGVEAVRMLISPDSIWVMDRIHNQYGLASLKDLQERFSLPFGNIETRQLFEYFTEVLLGNPVFPPVQSFESAALPPFYNLLGESKQIKSEYWLQGNTYQLARMTFADKQMARRALLQFGEYEPVGQKQNFAYFRSIDLFEGAENQATFEISFKEVELDVPKTIRFDIPDRYERVE